MNASRLSVKEKIDMARSTVSVKESRASLRDSMRKSKKDLNKSTVSIKEIPAPGNENLEKSTLTLRSNMGKSTFSLRSENGDMKWSDVQKSTLSVRPVEEEKPKNIFDDGEEKLEGCEKVLESRE